MKSRNREISIFSLSLMDVISGAMGAFLIVMVIQARYTAVNEGNDPEKLRPRLDAAMQALASIRAGTEKTIADRFEEGTTPRTLGLSGGETVPEIEALGKALQTDVDRIDNGFAHALEARGAAVRALENASAGTEKTFAAHMSRSKPATLGLKRGDTVPEITALGQALAKDIGTIEKGFETTINERNAAVSSQWTATAGTEKIFKDRIGAKPKTQGIARGPSLPEIEKLGQALQVDIDTIYRELRKSKDSVPTTPFAVTAVFGCGTFYLQIASNETDPRTGKPNPPYTPVPLVSSAPPNWRAALQVRNGSLQGTYGQYAHTQPAFTYLNAKAVAGRHYKIYLVDFVRACDVTVSILGPAVQNGEFAPSSDVRFAKVERVNLSWPRDSIELSDGKKYGVYFLGTLTVKQDRDLSFTRAGERARDAEATAIRERMEALLRSVEKKDQKPALSKEAVLARIDNLPVPENLPDCRVMAEGALGMVHGLMQFGADIKISGPESRVMMNEVMQDCHRNRFPEARTTLQKAVRGMLGEKKDDKPSAKKKDDRPWGGLTLQEKTENKLPLTREAMLAAVDKLPVPTEKRGCMQQVHNAFQSLQVMRSHPGAMRPLPPQDRVIASQIMQDCSRSRFTDAQEKLKAAMRQLLK